MNDLTVFPDKPITDGGPVSRTFLGLNINSFLDACRYVQALPYGYNSNRDAPLILFKEKMGNCTTKHAVIAMLASELDLAIAKNIGVYAMTEDIVTGTNQILDKYDLPYVPMVHCFLVHKAHSVDLTIGNHNGKNRPVDSFLYTATVAANISGRDEYLMYRKALKDLILSRRELKGVELKRILKARGEGLELLKVNIER
jgi:hypothetical protein